MGSLGTGLPTTQKWLNSSASSNDTKFDIKECNTTIKPDKVLPPGSMAHTVPEVMLRSSHHNNLCWLKIQVHIFPFPKHSFDCSTR